MKQEQIVCQKCGGSMKRYYHYDEDLMSEMRTWNCTQCDHKISRKGESWSTRDLLFALVFSVTSLNTELKGIRERLDSLTPPETTAMKDPYL